jgi:glyoxylate reductase
MEQPRVYVTRLIPEEGLAPLREATVCRVWDGELPPPREALLREVAEVEGLLCLLTDRVDAALLDAAPRLRVVSQMAVGVDNIDVAACTRRGIPVGYTPGVLAETTADLAWALLMATARRVVEADAYTRSGAWKTWEPMGLLGPDVHHATLGVIGLGGIGAEVARRARGFDMRLLYFSRQRKPGLEASLGLEYRPLDELLREADFVSLHCALTPETRHLIGARELALMKPTAILINTTRGPVVDQTALAAALKAGTIAAAGLDVFETEPVPPDDPILSLPNVVALPHIGSASVATRGRMARMAADNLLAAVAGQRPPNLVNPEVWERSGLP